MYRAKNNIVFILFTAFLLTLSGCAGLTKHLEAPTVHIADIRVKEIKALEASFNVQMRILNPNDISIFTKGINCDLEINNVHLATGVSGEAVEIPAFGTAIVPMEVFSSAFDVVQGIIALSNKEVVRYKIKGRLRLEGGSFMRSYVPFQSEGDIKIKGFNETP